MCYDLTFTIVTREVAPSCVKVINPTKIAPNGQTKLPAATTGYILVKREASLISRSSQRLQ